ncbi:hypothetical protein V8C35DRAFT_301924 [Trichoderma chlorosporum]
MALDTVDLVWTISFSLSFGTVSATAANPAHSRRECPPSSPALVAGWLGNKEAFSMRSSSQRSPQRPRDASTTTAAVC